MNHETPAPEDIPGADGIEVLQRQNQNRDENTRERNGTGVGADEEELGLTEEEMDDLEDDAEGG